jgi:Plant mobile domain
MKNNIFIIYFSISYLINYFVHPHNTLCLNAHRLKIPYNEQMDPYLHRSDFYQMTIMRDFQLDKSLLIVLVERWRPKTSIFYLPVGEITMTLEDVCCIWEFPIWDILLFLYIIFTYYFWSLLIWFWNIKNIKKSIIRVTSDKWSGTLQILFGLNDDPYVCSFVAIKIKK